MRWIDGTDVPGIVSHTITMEFDGDSLASVFRQATDYYERRHVTARVIAIGLMHGPDSERTALIVTTEHPSPPGTCSMCGALQRRVVSTEE